jgi:YgiT-type zinc finger domain-containing protein
MSATVGQCSQCYVGRYRAANMPYECSINHRKVVVPEVPGFLCDICGDSYYNPVYIEHLHRLISRSAVSGHKSSSAARNVATGSPEGGQPIGRSAKS